MAAKMNEDKELLICTLERAETQDAIDRADKRAANKPATGKAVVVRLKRVGTHPIDITPANNRDKG